MKALFQFIDVPKEKKLFYKNFKKKYSSELKGRVSRLRKPIKMDRKTLTP